MDTVWTFNTCNFRVTLECESERDQDLSWADDETLEKLESGEWQNLTFKVAIYDRNTGAEIASDYLGNSIYANPADFRDHRACGRANRERAAAGQAGRCGSYFTDMVHNAVAEARAAYAKPRAVLRQA